MELAHNIEEAQARSVHVASQAIAGALLDEAWKARRQPRREPDPARALGFALAPPLPEANRRDARFC